MIRRKAHHLGYVVPGARLWEQPKDIPPASSLELEIDEKTSRIYISQPIALSAYRVRSQIFKLNEPQSHLTRVAEALTSTLDFAQLNVLPLTYKDASLTRLLKQRRVSGIYYEPWSESLDILKVQSAISSQRETSGAPRLVLARHILEHARDLERFLQGMASLTGDGGFAFFEVPDSSSQLAARDLSMVWDEHIHYFTDSSLRRTLAANGWNLVTSGAGRFDGEDILWCVAECLSNRGPEPSSDLSLSRDLSQTYISEINISISCARARIIASGAERIVFIGANHVTSNLIDIVGVEELEIAVGDDAQIKQGKLTSSRGIVVEPIDELKLGSTDFIVVGVSASRSTGLMGRLAHVTEKPEEIWSAADWVSMRE